MRNILNIAHRGFTKTFPDNTLEAFEAAIQIRVDAIECDVHETADRRFVVFHDSELLGKNINNLSLDEIRNVRLKGKFRIPTLEQALDLCQERVRLLVELKQVSSLECFLSLLRARVKPTDVILASFNRDLVSKFSHLAPEIHRGIITGGPVKEPIKALKSAQSDILMVRFPFTTAELAEKVHAHNLSILVWGCTGLRDIQSTLELDIDGIVSDFPDQVAKELGKKEDGKAFVEKRKATFKG